MSEEAEVLVKVEGAVGRLTLNRPKAIHALTQNMCQIMTDALVAWRNDPAVKLVLLDNSGERGFCAGGDIKMLAESGAVGGEAASEFFKVEYRLNHLLFSYPKPVVAILDGIVMGGGVGISDPARYRVHTERTTFAMPETGIGLFPDVGGGWFLPRLPGKAGLWLALTGARIKAADCRLFGVGTHYVQSADVEALKAAIIADPGAVETIMARADADPGPAPQAPHKADIDRLFAGDTVEAIFAALEADGGEWAAAQLATLKTKSPQAMKVSLRQLQAGAKMTDFVDNMVMEYRLGGRVVQTHDFQEGVRAVVVDKDNKPDWKPATIEGVTDAMLDALFAPLPADQEWTPLAEAAK
ncbi:MAG: enoyl-CoA hydratase/isomerase family protein [Caulobacteraceae bacterium]|nr:enoyl-CoA hydratase/isomerase family protein [Caulobacteraceae bacterium]